MRRTRNARIVVADALLATSLQYVLVAIEIGGRDGAQILFDDRLVLRRGRNEPGIEDRPFRIEPIEMIEQAARRFGTRIADSGAWRGGDKGLCRRFVFRDQIQRLATGINDLDGAHEDAAERVPTDWFETDLISEGAYLGWQAVAIQRIPRHWS